MSDSDEESPASLIGVLVAIAVAVAISVTLFMQPKVPPSSAPVPPAELTGVVLSSGPISLSKNMGGTRELARVQLADGSVVSALVAAGGPLSQGDVVVFTTDIAPRVGIGVSLPQYEVVAKR